MKGIVLILGLALLAARPSSGVEVRAGVDHSEWDRLVRRWVDDRGLVDYGGLKASPDHKALISYLGLLAQDAEPRAEGHERAATLINAYNALTIAWVLSHYPTPSIRALDDSFGTARHHVGGVTVSLDDIEHKGLRPLAGYRVHAALVCAARSCPPLMRDAYRAERLDEQLDFAMKRWLAREDLNRFDLETGTARVSSIFKWFGEDFDKAGGVKAVLVRHGPADARKLFERDKVKTLHLDYDWSLNDQAKRHEYGRLRRLWDAITDAF